MAQNFPGRFTAKHEEPLVVGIWHETFLVARGQFECIYANMPRFGLAKAGEHVPVTGGLESARTRIEQPQ